MRSIEEVVHKGMFDANVWIADAIKDYGEKSRALPEAMRKRLAPVVASLQRSAEARVKLAKDDEAGTRIAKDFRAGLTAIVDGITPSVESSPSPYTTVVDSYWVEISPGVFRLRIQDLLAALDAGGRTSGGVK